MTASIEKRLVLVLVIILTVLMSKTYYFGVKYRDTFQYVYYAAVVLGAIICGAPKTRLVQKIVTVAPFMLICAISLVLHYDDMRSNNINAVIGIALAFFCCALLSSYVSRVRFARVYIKVMLFYSVVSLVCVFIANVSPETAKLFCQPGYDWKSDVGYSLLYTWGWNGFIFDRNSGPFWEPGAFQGFLIIAVLFLLYEVDKDPVTNKKMSYRKTCFLVMLLTILTTRSTTGYILLLLILITNIERIQRVMQGNKKHARYLISVMLGVFVLFVILNSGNITEKFIGSKARISTVQRFADMRNGIALSVKSGLWGFGETGNRDLMKQLIGIGVDDSSGFTAMAYTYGMLFLIWYLILLVRNLPRVFSIRRIWEHLVLIMVFVILHMTEGLWFLPVYIDLLLLGDFPNRQAKKYSEGKGEKLLQD